jgi:5-methylthioadenosine/S-adenosylhomocysteine deaminase
VNTFPELNPDQITVTQLLLPKYVVPVIPRGTVLEDFAVAITDGRIDKVGPRDLLCQQMSQAERIDLKSHVLMPGLINMHTHSPMTLLRGYADDLRLDTWLNEHIWPAEQRWADSEFVRDGTELAIAEMIHGGTTCFNENYFYPDQIAGVVKKSGMRACIGIPVIDFATSWAATFDEYLQKGMEVRSRFADCDELNFSIAPHSMYSVSDSMLERIADISLNEKMTVHLHLLEIEWEIENSLLQHGMRPLHRAKQLGLLNSRLNAVHMAHLDDEDIALLAENEVNVVHCPQSNFKLSSGMCRLADLVTSGVNVSVGTDGAASNNDLDLLDELRTAALLAKGLSGDPTVIDSEFALELITINAAKSLGVESELGSIEEGKIADLCALDLAHPRTQPMHNIFSQIVYAAASSQMTDVWVAGRRLMANKKLTSLDEEEILCKAENWAKRMQSKPGNGT